jgi:bifunctional non-homologous end joining protein LigD
LLSLDVTSVLTGRTNGELVGANAVREDHKSRARVTERRSAKAPDATRVNGARKGLLPLFIEPSLASPDEHPPRGDQWWHEVKFDGYRKRALTATRLGF